MKSFFRKSMVLGIPALWLGILVWGMPSLALSGERYVNFDADPAAFGINGETIDMTEFEVEYYRIPTDENKVGFVMKNMTQPNNYVQIRGIIPLQDGQTFTLDGIAALPYITVDRSTLGSLAPATQMPGSDMTKIDNIYELDSALQFGSPFFRLRDNMGTINDYFDLDSDFYPAELSLIENSEAKWNRVPTGYNFTTPFSTFNTYHSSQGDPLGWSPGQLKNWKILVKANMINSGEIDIANATVKYQKGAISESVSDEEILSKNIASVASPFTAGMGSQVPDAYIIMARLQNNSDIYSTTFNGGSQMPWEPISLLLDSNGDGWGMYAPNADDGSGIFPGGIPPSSDLWQRDRLDPDGSANSTLSTPTVGNETSSFGSVKAMWAGEN